MSWRTRQEGSVYPGAVTAITLIFYIAFKGLLDISFDHVSVFWDTCRRLPPRNPNSYPKLAVAIQIGSYYGQFKDIRKMVVPNAYAAHFWHSLTHSNMGSSLVLRNQLQIINLSKAVCLFLESFTYSFPDIEVHLSELWLTHATMPTGCHTCWPVEKQRQPNQLVYLCHEYRPWWSSEVWYFHTQATRLWLSYCWLKANTGTDYANYFVT